jgi:hypothetical protein
LFLDEEEVSMTGHRISILFVLLGILVLSVSSLACSVMDAISDILSNPSIPIEKELERQVQEDGQAQPGELPPASAPSPVGPGIDVSSDLQLKPVVFHNLGTVAYTVSAWTYTPPGASESAIPSIASTVAIPGGNTSSSLSLPLGTYTWCYWWELGDINNDGMIEYAHAVDERPVTLDESSSDDLDFAVSVDLSAPVDLPLFGLCGLDFAPFVVEQYNVDRISGAYIGLAHDRDTITVRGPITFIWWYVHAEVQIAPGVATETTTPEVVTLAAGETMSFELVEYRGDHPGDWNLYLWLISVNE